MVKTHTNLIQDARAMSVVDLRKNIDQDRITLQELRSQLAIGKLTRHHQLRAITRRIARLLTVLREKTMLESINQDGK